MLPVVIPTQREFAALVAPIEELVPASLGRLETASTPAGDLDHPTSGGQRRAPALERLRLAGA